MIDNDLDGKVNKCIYFKLNSSAEITYLMNIAENPVHAGKLICSDTGFGQVYFINFIYLYIQVHCII